MPSPRLLHSKNIRCTPGRELVVKINGMEILIPLGVIHSNTKIEVVEQDRTQKQVIPGTITTRPLTGEAREKYEAAVKGLNTR
jgi:propanediol utilization protein